MSEEKAISGTQAKVWDQGKNEGHIRKKTHGAEHKQGFLSGKALEYNLSGKEDHYTLILKPHPDTASCGALINPGSKEKGWQEMGTSRDQDLG